MKGATCQEAWSMTDAIKPCPVTLSEGLLGQAQVLSDEGSDCGCEACVVARSSIGQRLATDVLAAHKRIAELEAVLKGIAHHRSIAYDSHTPATSVADRQWQIGFTDGVRDCVERARQALASKPTEGEG